jgi:hypothetical protein
MNAQERIPLEESARLLESAIDLTVELRSLAPDGDLNQIAALLQHRGEVLDRVYQLRRNRLADPHDEHDEGDVRMMHAKLEMLRAVDAEFQDLLERRKRGVLGALREANESRNLESYTRQVT